MKKEKENVFKIVGLITHEVATELAMQIMEISATPGREKETIVIYINSQGGFYTAANAIIDAMEAHEGEVVTYNLGCADSAASVVFMAGKKRIMNKRATILMHEVRYIHQDGSVEFERDESIMNNYLKECNKQLVNDYYNFTKKCLTKKQIKSLMKKETLFTAEKALVFGLADKIIK